MTMPKIFDSNHQASRRTVLTGALVVVGATVAPAAAAALGDAPQGTVDGTAKASVRHLELAGTGKHRAIQASSVPSFSVVGISWQNPDIRLDAKAEVRSHSSATGTWSAWLPLSQGHARDSRAARGGTEPLWTGPSDGIEVRVKAGDKDLPKGLRVAMVTPGSGGTTRSGPAGTHRAVGIWQPPVITNREGWGADESLVLDPPQYMNDTKAVFVHHTAGINDYTSEQSPGIVRGIFLYHVEELGWNDLGYNFLVDKYGTVFEGRAGGIDRSVRAAHTFGFNTDTSSIALLGNTEDAAVTAETKRAIASVASWKLRLHGYAPDEMIRLPAGANGGNFYGETWKLGDLIDFHRIPGHRNGFNTLCPGEDLYNALPEIRDLAANK
ncbi:N-acetylmuramoyl-L-alanine amidase [Streptomyces sp. NPDC058579]|uniref:N-acetylmuramoyl-L-alanine amidase n=1 Tax=Streptomyces sp. NPDC058579 TaxID=3346548 RepID=UPI003654FEAB